ncbi:peptide ABC transporter ATP-binding protein [Candidatus Desantisbacteria bacterium CG2_30_40_21]|uniref:Peptide ABC transporter ATP-binding protein n=5 Tax=unclassified Candidatus Desantisiibacteriota TaxID=3106372 RepID=A0A2M7JA14_9BACT|nr:MAG: peptide ABC transporter ATP-binding protein [Candidatus Desantisbacteria bacterium CG2_30_40_21]PIP40344.1 MAG: peptide ABC transporter ATP-binding protein [Candidatus Desantisbacteria bacterium CG23_combo_of_CG06-09_8_20_14_all_40_23]PIX16249.1 MAG: peptide ABC transporter ATP-binding protein [Candidatus Desantisbacteria bacterium CG_4_8_14_3_um_filter_40_12]PIY19835.1 MAG: peptide ABC transporter ATP-binding protein [Candidatus Desantisbacteria bacterium CG_4_10_14_3_um_filter_40_18]P
MPETLLEIKGLKTHIHASEGIVKAVDGIDFKVDTGEIVGIIGESGCGKSMTALSILRLLPSQAKIAGEILYQGNDLLKYDPSQMREIRGKGISMIFQDPTTSLNPVFTVGNQICEAITLHQKISQRAAVEKAIEILRLCGLPSPEEQFKRYPHQLSGGMNQRVMIAMALVTHPELLIADEPTTALDVTIQAQILDLIQNLQAKLNMSVLLITHDLSIISTITRRVIIMYAGKIVEYAQTDSLFASPLHPYTKGLINSIPNIESTEKRLNTIPGVVPNPMNLPCGCRFHPRCPEATLRCFDAEPEIRLCGEGHGVRCFGVRQPVSSYD